VDPDVSGNFSSLGHNLIGDGTSSTGFTASGDQVGTSLKPINPLLTAVGNFLVPQQTSRALQAGDASNAPATDERGQPRIVDDDRNLDSDGPKIDIGAVDFQPTEVSITASGSPGSASPGGTITYTITVKTGKGDNPSVSNLTLNDAIPAQTTFESFTAPGGWSVSPPAVGGTGTVTATFVSLGPSSTASFTLKVKVNTSVTASSTTNTATIKTTSPDPTTADNSATVKTVLSALTLLSPQLLPGTAVASATADSATPQPPKLSETAGVALAGSSADMLPSSVLADTKLHLVLWRDESWWPQFFVEDLLPPGIPRW
jgi:uncharacterized repeat protein (TIGR01451 family)